MASSNEIKPFLWFTLYQLMKLGAVSLPIITSTSELSSTLGCSQQSASRHLKLLEEMGLIERKIEQKGSHIKITPRGCETLENVYRELQYFMYGEPSKPLIIEGEVVSGLYQGGYYISREGYREQIKEKLGFEPFPGTLNIKIPPEEFEKRRRLENRQAIILEGFRNEDRAYGSCKCYPVLVNGEVEGALIVAERTIHEPDIMEIISPVYLRKSLELTDGDQVTVVFSNPPRCAS
jgi:riboflavin kinase